MQYVAFRNLHLTGGVAIVVPHAFQFTVGRIIPLTGRRRRRDQGLQSPRLRSERGQDQPLERIQLSLAIGFRIENRDDGFRHCQRTSGAQRAPEDLGCAKRDPGVLGPAFGGFRAELVDQRPELPRARKFRQTRDRARHDRQLNFRVAHSWDRRRDDE